MIFKNGIKIDDRLCLVFIPYLIYKLIKEYVQKKRLKKADHNKYQHLHLPTGEFEKRFPQYKK